MTVRTAGAERLGLMEWVRTAAEVIGAMLVAAMLVAATVAVILVGSTAWEHRGCRKLYPAQPNLDPSIDFRSDGSWVRANGKVLGWSTNEDEPIWDQKRCLVGR